MTDPTDPEATSVDARADWEQRIYRRLTDVDTGDPSDALAAPADVEALSQQGFVLLRWSAVDGAVGYIIERRDGDGAEPHIIAHGGSDVPAVPGSSFADTGLTDGVTYTYRVGAVARAEGPAWNWSEPVSAQPAEPGDASIVVVVDASEVVGALNRVWHMVGSERLTQLTFGPDPHGHDIGREFARALQLARDDLGVGYVRAHAIFHDDNHVVSVGDDGRITYDFTVIDRLYDEILRIGIRPIVELSFMPAALAADPEQTVFGYRGIISPPRDWEQWRDLVNALARHLVDRYGIDEVSQWGFEVWNEPNLEVFWTGTQDEYFRLYAESARAVKSVDDRLTVGGPSTAAGEWVGALAEYAQEHQLPLDFATSHTYGNVPVDVRPELNRRGFDKAPIWWTEWGVGSTHFGPIHDGVIGAPFVLSGFAGVQDRMDALAYWVISDHFEELGRPPRLFHNGFGLLTVGNLRKPRYWAAHLAAHQGSDVLASSVRGDGADVLVQAWATRHDDGVVDVLVWNGTVNGALQNGDPRLDRHVALEISGLDPASSAELARVDHLHSNILSWAPVGVDWPDEGQWAELRSHDRLHTETVALPASEAGHRLEFDLPMPGVARIRVTPPSNAQDSDERAAG